jgi:hypothetical protein
MSASPTARSRSETPERGFVARLRAVFNPRYGPTRLWASGAAPAALAAIVVAGVAGWVVGDRLAPGTAAPTAQRPVIARLGSAGVTLRAGWRPAARPVAVPGLTGARAFAPADGTAGRLVVALAPGIRILPAATVAALRIPLGGAERLRIAGRPAVGYTALALRGVPGLVDVYSVPTVAGTVMVACVAPLADPLPPDSCPGDMLAIPARAPADPARQLRARAPAILGRLDRIRVSERAALQRASTAAAQARSARRLADAYADAAAAARPVAPAGVALPRALSDAADAYGRLALAATRRSGPGWSHARHAVYMAEHRLRAALRF